MFHDSFLCYKSGTCPNGKVEGYRSLILSSIYAAGALHDVLLMGRAYMVQREAMFTIAMLVYAYAQKY